MNVLYPSLKTTQCEALPALVERLRSRDSHAMAELYDRFGKRVYWLVYHLTGDRTSAEDLVQETFLRVWNRLHTFHEERGLIGPWIFAIARNCAIDYRRSLAGRMSQPGLQLPYVEGAAELTHQDRSILNIDRSRILDRAFEKLSPNQRTVLELAYREGLSQTEMAERMQQPLGTVKTWVRTALKILREDLSEQAAVA